MNFLKTGLRKFDDGSRSSSVVTQNEAWWENFKSNIVYSSGTDERSNPFGDTVQIVTHSYSLFGLKLLAFAP